MFFIFWSAFVRDHVSCKNVSTILWRHDLTTLSLLYNTSAINRIWLLRIFSSRDSKLFSESRTFFSETSLGMSEQEMTQLFPKVMIVV